MKHIWDAHVPMRDGVNLSADVYMPDEEGSYPTIVIGTPYDNTMKSHVDMARFFVKHGYTFVVYDVRGRHDSEGEFYPFFNEGPDGHDLVEWTAEQPWSNGKIGMMGGSYRGWIQWATAKERPPHLTTMVPTATGGKYMEEFPFFNGIPCLWMLGWLNFVGARTNQNTAAPSVDWERVYNQLPLETMPEALGRDLPVWNEWLSHPDLDEFWKAINFTDDDFKGIDLPILHITGYYDGDQPGALHYYDNTVRYSPAKDKQYMLIGPWDHPGTRFPQRYLGGVDFTNTAVMNMAEVHLAWFDRWIKGKGNEVDKWPKTKYFVMGENKWVKDNDYWAPSKASYTDYYLHSNGNANTLRGDGALSKEKPKDEPNDTYTYNPKNPVIPGVGFDFYGERDEPPLDSRYLLRKDDYLVYTSDHLKEAVTVAGRPIAELYCSSDCVDTDWFVYLMDVHPDGRSILVSRGLLRARYRNGLEKQELMNPETVYKFTLEMNSTCVKYLEGHSIRIAVTSSEFPRYARNNNTGKPIASDTEMRIAHNKVHHMAAYPSVVKLPLL
ncbi:MAG: CocE/NonD family hydrolase [Candidatus Bathyarchaeota archaeon]|nr:CocE/NonD family hydrolase [Candidatus Bathyarchaeota archaeon]